MYSTVVPFSFFYKAAATYFCSIFYLCCEEHMKKAYSQCRWLVPKPVYRAAFGGGFMINLFNMVTLFKDYIITNARWFDSVERESSSHWRGWEIFWCDCTVLLGLKSGWLKWNCCACNWLCGRTSLGGQMNEHEHHYFQELNVWLYIDWNEMGFTTLANDTCIYSFSFSLNLNLWLC